MKNKLFQTPFAYLLFFSQIFLFYIVLFPFHGWTIPKEPIFEIVLYGWLDNIYLFDIVQNLLLFLPMGLFGACDLLLKRYSLLLSCFMICCASFTTSLFIEVLQTFNPVRIPSLLDISLNTISGFIGALCAPLVIHYYPKMVQEIKASILQNSTQNPWAWLGVLIWVCWAMFELYPYIPTIHPQQLLLGIDALRQYARGDLDFNTQMFIYYCILGTILYLAGRLFLTTTRLVMILFAYIFLVILGKISVVTLVLEPEFLMGCIMPTLVIVIGTKLAYFMRGMHWRTEETANLSQRPTIHL